MLPFTYSNNYHPSTFPGLHSSLKQFLYPCAPCFNNNFDKKCNSLKPVSILAQWDYSLLPSFSDPIECIDVNPDKPYLLAPRYYLVIKIPTVSLNLLPKEIRVPIDHSGILANSAQLVLPECVSNQKEHLYKVEYWEWRKAIRNRVEKCRPKCQFNTWMEDDIDTKKLKEEYWYVKSNSNECNKDLYNINSLELQRCDDDSVPYRDNFDSIYKCYPDIFQEVFYITNIKDQEGNTLKDGILSYKEMQSPNKYRTGERIVKDIGIGWARGPIPGTKYYVDYLSPVNLCDIVYDFKQKNCDYQSYRTIYYIH